MNELDDFLCEIQCEDFSELYNNDLDFWSWIEDYNEEMRSKI